MAVRRKPIPCATGPGSVPEWFSSAITEAGHELVDISQAEALFWYHGGSSTLGDLLEAGSRLQWVQLPAAGIESYLPYLDPRLIWTCAKGVYADPVAEHALALALAGMRGTAHYGRQQSWSEPRGVSLFDANVTILGGGGIGQALVDLLRPFRVEPLLVRRNPRPEQANEVALDQLHEVLPTSDLVILALALTPETAGVIGERELRLMAPHAWLVNVSRGRHVVTEDLVRALREGWIGGAALDVTDPEPLPNGHELWTLDDCLITPHIGNTPEMNRPLLRAFTMRNLRHRAAAEPLEGLVDPALGY